MANVIIIIINRTTKYTTTDLFLFSLVSLLRRGFWRQRRLSVWWGLHWGSRVHCQWLFRRERRVLLLTLSANKSQISFSSTVWAVIIIKISYHLYQAHILIYYIILCVCVCVCVCVYACIVHFISYWNWMCTYMCMCMYVWNTDSLLKQNTSHHRSPARERHGKRKC